MVSPSFLSIRWLLLPILVLLIAACGNDSITLERPAVPIEAKDKLIPIIAISELVVGENRLPIGIVKNGVPINDPDMTLHLRFFYLDGEDKATVQQETDALYRGEGLPVGLYVAHPELDRAGAWGVEVQIPTETGEIQANRIRLDVLPESSTPALGSKAIPSENLTSADVPDLSQLTSDSNPDPDFYTMTIADALDAKQPFVVAFVTPGFCRTAVCAPNMGVLKKLKDQYGEQVNFLHIEVYPYPFDKAFEEVRFVPAMQEWNLVTEPWLFLVDSDGIIRGKYEGGLTFAELEPAIQQLIDPALPTSTNSGDE